MSPGDELLSFSNAELEPEADPGAEAEHRDLQQRTRGRRRDTGVGEAEAWCRWAVARRKLLLLLRQGCHPFTRTLRPVLPSRRYSIEALAAERLGVAREAGGLPTAGSACITSTLK